MMDDLITDVRHAMESVELAKSTLRLARDNASPLAKHRMDRVLRELDAPSRSLRTLLEELGFGAEVA